MKPSLRFAPLLTLACIGPAFSLSRPVASPDAGPSLYSVTVLEPGSVAGKEDRTYFQAINNRGDLIGVIYSKAGPRSHLWHNGAATEIVPPAGLQCYATGLNDRGQVVGQMYPPGAHLKSEAFVWEAGRITRLAGLGGDSASAHWVNNLGLIVGSAQNASGEMRPVLWEDGHIRDLGTLGGKGGWASAVNERGQVAGASRTASGDQHAFLWQGGKMTDLGTLPGYPDSNATAINDAGQIAGDVSWGRGVDAPSGRHTFLWEKGKMTDLGTTGGTHGHPLSINKDGLVVGMSFTAAKKQCGYLYRAGKMAPLNGLLTPKDAALWDVYFAMTVNDKGWILAAAHQKGKDERAMVLLKPVAAK